MRLSGIDEQPDRICGDDFRKAADVVGMCMGRHHRIESFDVLTFEVRNDMLPHLAFAGVNEQGLIAELKEDRIALSDVDEVDDEVSG